MLGFAHTNDSKPQIKSYLWLLECILMEISTINIKMPCGKNKPVGAEIGKKQPHKQHESITCDQHLLP